MLETASVQALFSHSKAGTWQQLVRDLGSVAGPQPGLGAAGKLLNLAKASASLPCNGNDGTHPAGLVCSRYR